MKATVNNFVAACAAGDFGWPWSFIRSYPFPWFSRAGGSGLLTSSRLNDFELYGPPAGRDLTL
jgi:hypothetical protein